MSTRSDFDGAARALAIVDDDEDVRNSLGELLVSFGYDVILYASADEFLSSVDMTQFSCVISDLHMPGTDGLKLAAILRGMGMPFVLITAYPSADLDERAAAANVAAFFRKPFDPIQLVDRLAEILGPAE